MTVENGKEKSVKVGENNNVEVNGVNGLGHINTSYVISKEDLNAPPTADPEDRGAFEFHHEPGKH